MDFFRQLNKNVKESLSILNEGLQITNGVFDIRGTHLPYLLQLCPSHYNKDDKTLNCCIFSNFMNSDVYITFGRDITHVKPSNTMQGDLEVEDKDSMRETLCSLGGECLLINISYDRFNDSINFIKSFLDVLNNLYDASTDSSRTIIDTQTTLLLYELTGLAELSVFMDYNDYKFHSIFQNVDLITSSLLSLSISSTRQLATILSYPKSLLMLDNSNSEYDICRIELRKYDLLIREMHALDDYDLLGNLRIIHMDDAEVIQLKHYLELVDGISDISMRTSNIFKLMKLCYSEHSARYNDVIYEILLLLSIVIAYNDINWHVSETNDTILYQRDKYDSNSCNLYLCHNGDCFNCNKPMVLKGEDIMDYCSCVINNYTIDSSLLDVIYSDDYTNIKLLLKFLKIIKHPSTIAIIIGILLQLCVKADGFIDVLYELDGFDIIVSILQDSFSEQFYLLRNTFDKLKYDDEFIPANTLSFINFNDLKIAMTFLPHTVNSLLLIQYSIRRTSIIRDRVKYILEYTGTLLETFIYYKCADSFTSISSTLSNFYSQMLFISMDICTWLLLQTYTYDSQNPFVVNLIDNIRINRIWDDNNNSVFTCVLFSFIICSNLVKFGIYIEPNIMGVLTNYLVISFNLLESYRNHSLINALTEPVINIPEIYKFVFTLLYMKEKALNTTDVNIIHDLRLGSFRNMLTIPQLVHLALCIFDFIIATSINEILRLMFLKLFIRLKFFENEMCFCEQFCDFLSSICNEHDSDHAPILVMICIEIASNSIGLNERVPFIKNPLNFIISALSNPLLPSIFILQNLTILLSLPIDTLKLIEYDALLNIMYNNNDSISKSVASMILSYLLSIGAYRDVLPVDFLPVMISNISTLYSMDDVKVASSLLSIDDLYSSSDITLSFDSAVDRFNRIVHDKQNLNFIWLFYWHRNNIVKFAYPPFVYKFIIAYRLYINLHIMELLSNKTESNIARMASTTRSMSGNEMDFVNNKISNLQSQLSILANYVYLSDMNCKKLKDQIRLLENENQILRSDNIDKQEITNLAVKLESEIIKHGHLNDKHNKLLEYVSTLKN